MCHVNFHPLEVVAGRGSETQLHVGENLNLLVYASLAGKGSSHRMTSQQTFDPMLGQCWAGIADSGQTEH